MVFGYGYRDFGRHVVTEAADPFGPAGDRAVDRHVEAMRVKEQLALGAEGIEGIALRFGLFHGAGGTGALVELLRRRRLPAVADHGRVLPRVDLADAGRAVALAVDGGRAGEAYNIVDDTPMGFGAHVRTVAEAFATPKPPNVPSRLMRGYPYAHRMVTTNMRVSNAKAKAELGRPPVTPTAPKGCAHSPGAVRPRIVPHRPEEARKAVRQRRHGAESPCHPRGGRHRPAVGTRPAGRPAEWFTVQSLVCSSLLAAADRDTPPTAVGSSPRFRGRPGPAPLPPWRAGPAFPPRPFPAHPACPVDLSAGGGRRRIRRPGGTPQPRQCGPAALTFDKAASRRARGGRGPQWRGRRCTAGAVSPRRGCRGGVRGRVRGCG
ncbi:hypothetical protein [Streptomyces yangpuensis]|uniref:hypothetical protein n=1 Tax=Streptomyces yangpuensis TaxID=1648182 RepID=UPI00365B9C49